MNFSLKDKWVLITGASSGFGAAAARAFGAQGAKLLLGARRLNRLEEIAAQARQAGSPLTLAHALDVTQTESVESFMSWAREQIQKAPSAPPRLDVLINNAGGAHGLEPIAQGKDTDWETMFQTNVLGLLRVTRAALPLLVANPGASIINVGSNAGHEAYEGGGAYCAAKAGERQISRTLRLELNGTGVRVTSIDPGMARTEFALVRYKGDVERARKLYEGVNPLTAEDIADVMIWVACRPPHVNIDEMLIKPVDQASMTKIHRRINA